MPCFQWKQCHVCRMQYLNAHATNPVKPTENTRPIGVLDLANLVETGDLFALRERDYAPHSQVEMRMPRSVQDCVGKCADIDRSPRLNDFTSEPLDEVEMHIEHFLRGAIGEDGVRAHYSPWLRLPRSEKC